MRHGILLIDKPEGPTSHDVVAQVRRILHEQNIGHLGTLDPLATGLLVLFVGNKALKCVELFRNCDKTYEARIVFGTVSSTYDREGVLEEVTPNKGWTPPTELRLTELLQTKFLGTITQVPPLHSAVHIDGKRAYEVIRQYEQATRYEIRDTRYEQPLPSLPERQVTISKIHLISYAYPHALIWVDCSSGTYIRSLAHDLGQALRCGGYLEGLKRTRVGMWRVEDAYAIEIPITKRQSPNKSKIPIFKSRDTNTQQETSNEQQSISWKDVIPLKEALINFPRCELTGEQWKAVQHGRSMEITMQEEPVIAWYEGLPVAILERKGKSQAHPRKVL